MTLWSVNLHFLWSRHVSILSWAMLWMKWAHPEWFPNDINISLTFSIPFTFICCHITVSQVSYKPESNEKQSKEMDPVSPFYDQWFCTFVFGYSKTNYKIHTLNYKNISAQQFKSSNIRIGNGSDIFKKKSLKLWKFKNHLSTSIHFGALCLGKIWNYLFYSEKQFQRFLNWSLKDQ